MNKNLDFHHRLTAVGVMLVCVLVGAVIADYGKYGAIGSNRGELLNSVEAILMIVAIALGVVLTMALIRPKK